MNRVLLTGNSMKPFFLPGDILAVAETPVEELRVGNVVVFQAPKARERIVHRIVDRQSRDGRSFLVTRGDNNPHLKERVLPEWVLGRVIGKLQNNRLSTISRAEELLCLCFSPWYRKLRLLSHRPCQKVISILYPLLPVRFVSLGQGESKKTSLAVFLGRVVAKKKPTAEGDSPWVHPLFRGTPIAHRMDDSNRPPGREMHCRT